MQYGGESYRAIVILHITHSPTSPFPQLPLKSSYSQLLRQLNNHFYNTDPILGNLQRLLVSKQGGFFLLFFL